VLEDLIATGLTQHQAAAYALLLEHGALTPPALAKQLKLTRTNAYKLLETMEDLGIATRSEEHNKIIYEPGNPMALSNLVAEQRNIASAREDAVKQALNSLLTKFHKHSEEPDVSVVSGHDAVVAAYRRQIHEQQEIFFIRSRADIATMGFEAMHVVRTEPARHGQKRHGITPDLSTGTTQSKGDARSSLERTWVRQEDYTAPVEWSVSGSSLLIIMFGAVPHAVTIQSPIIANAFEQLWKLLDTCLRSMPYYKTLPR
jgi:predicted transcriptional regulator